MGCAKRVAGRDLVSSVAQAVWMRIYRVEQGVLFFGLLCELCDSVFDVFVFEVLGLVLDRN